MNYRLPSIFLALSLAGAPALAQTIKPGFWQFDNKITSNDAQNDSAMAAALRQMGNLPPEQRKAMAEMAAKQGVTMPVIGTDGTISSQICITPEMAARKQIPTGQPGKCTSNNLPVPGGMKLAFSCTDPQSRGEGKLTYQGDDAFTVVMNLVTSASGAQQQMTVNSKGKWLGTCPVKAR